MRSAWLLPFDCRRALPAREVVFKTPFRTPSAAASAGRPSWRSAAGAGGLPAVLLHDRFDELLLGHRGATLDPEASRDLVQVVLARVGVHALRARLGPGPWPRRCRLAVRGALGPAGLVLPVIADLLERVLQRAVRRAVGALALAVLLDRRVMGLDPGPLRLLRRTPKG